MSGGTPGASQVLLPQIASAYQADPRTALVKALLAQGQQNNAPVLGTGSTVARALTLALPSLASAIVQGQYQDQNAAAQKTIQDAVGASQPTKQWVDPDTGQVAIPGKAGSMQDMISALSSNPTTAPQALQLQIGLAQQQAASRAALVGELAKSGLTFNPDGSGVSAIPGYGQGLASITGANEGAKANAQVPAHLTEGLASKGLLQDGNGGVALIPGYAPGVAGVAGATKGAEAGAQNASDLQYKPLITAGTQNATNASDLLYKPQQAGATAAATLPIDLYKDYTKPQAVRPGGSLIAPSGTLAQAISNAPSVNRTAPMGAPASLSNALVGPPPVAPAPMGAPGSPSSPDALAALQNVPGANQQLPPVQPGMAAALNMPNTPSAAPAPIAGTPPPAAFSPAASTPPTPVILAGNDGGAQKAAGTNEDLYKEYQNYATNNQTLSQNLRNAADTFKYFQSGQSVPMQAQAAAWAKAAGIDPDKINLADPAQVQIAQKAATQALFSQMAGAKNPALGEYNMLQSAVAGPALQPEAAKSIIANSLAKVAYQNDHFQEMANYRKGNGDSMSGYDPSPFIIGAGAKMPQYVDQVMQSLPTFKGEQALPQHAAVPAPALSFLKANDSPATRAAFDQKYGFGAAATAMGQ